LFQWQEVGRERTLAVAFSLKRKMGGSKSGVAVKRKPLMVIGKSPRGFIVERWEFAQRQRLGVGTGFPFDSDHHPSLHTRIYFAGSQVESRRESARAKVFKILVAPGDFLSLRTRPWRLLS
jgi:hypothetical protein